MEKLNLIFSSINILCFFVILQNVYITVARIFLQILKIPKLDREIAVQKLAELIIKFKGTDYSQL